MNKKLYFLLLITSLIISRKTWSGENQLPNIVIILADDLGFGDVSAFNPGSKIKTPQMDSLASQGIRFTNFHTSSSVCTPTRYGLLTGRYAWRTTLEQGVLDGYSNPLIPSGRLTMASMLKKNGYTTAFIGKWHLGWIWGKKDDNPEEVDFKKPIAEGPLSVGFDYFFGISASLDMPPYVFVENNLASGIPDTITENSSKLHLWRKGPAAKGFRHGQVLSALTGKASEFLSDHPKEQPFFLFFSLTAPHTPVLPSDEFKGKSGLNEYGDFVLEVDHVVGRIVKELKDKNIFENTLLIITSDNGCSPAAGTSDLEKSGHYPSAGFRGYKADLFEGGHRVPFILTWPDKIRQARSCNQIICSTDLMRTFARLTGYKLKDNEGEDSFSFDAVIQSTNGHTHRKYLVAHSYFGNFSIQEKNLKLLLTPYSGGWSYPQQNSMMENDPDLQLYHMKKDSGETTNLLDRYPGKVNKLRKQLISYIARGRSTPGKTQRNDRLINIGFQ